LHNIPRQPTVRPVIVFIDRTEFIQRDNPNPIMAFRQTFRAPYGGDWQEIILRHLQSLKYGSVEIIIQDSRIVQLEITERFRLIEPSRPLDLPKPVQKAAVQAS